ncbi:ABC transporter ATP-binding protein [Amycolatopsis keratiniphila]|uniref:ABC transporter ATP-binding protein n=1 Tax=Amycolatopsis keratiniphila TaxID=129921 RepID=UPI00087A8DCB|nr:ABC transporter ATP-binding protein [Amycolatopsis keratiniphila]OLZ52918.1 ABC transporter permease [Amycolatopsis keratiniphila subsp. nogabecina]SDU06826.1 ATP-binding cassette, subfamily B [Amycolatopsis keratiniphila]
MKTPRLKVLWSFARPHKGALAIGLVLALLGSATGLATPMVTKWVLDSLGSSASLAGPVLALLGLMVVGAVIWLVQWILLGTVGERVVLKARESMVRRFFRATIPAITKRPTGELVTRVTSDTVLLREAASSSVIGLINGVVMLVGTLVLMSVLDLVLLATTVAAVLVVIALFTWLMPAIAKEQEKAQDRVGRLGGVLEGALRAIRTVKASRAETRQADRILVDAEAATAHGVRAVRREAVAWVVAWTGIQAATLVILGLGAWRVGAGLLEVSSLIAFLLYAFALMEPITELSQNMTALQAGIAAAGRIREMDALEVEEDHAPARAASAGDHDGPVLELRGVTAGYGGDPALRDVSLAIPRRGHTAIVGPSGAGKTTMLSLIMRFVRPESGALLLDGREYADLPYADVRSRLAYVEQETPIVPGTIRENLLFTHPDATEEEVRRALAEVRLSDKIAALEDGLDTPLSSTSVSGGERQRIALARAILRTPDVVLLDEATAQVDGRTESAIHDCIRRLAREGAVVTVAHRLSTVIDADTIVVMEEGRVRASGSHEHLLATDTLYRELVEALRIAGEAAPVPG